MRIPFDSLNLNAVVAEAQRLVGSKFEGVTQTGPLTFVLKFWSGTQHWLLVSVDPVSPRCYLLSRRPEGTKDTSPLVQELRRLPNDGVVEFVRQRGLDRILEIGLKAGDDHFRLIAELMGKHSNLMLVNPDGVVTGAAKWVGPSKSVRPILPKRPYEPPPFEPRPTLLAAKPGEGLLEYEGVSPFLAKLIAAGLPLEQVQSVVQSKQFTPVYAHGHGAYPLPLDPLGIQAVARASISQALEQHFESFVDQEQTLSSKNSLKSQLERVLLAREVALNDLEQAVETARNARAIQVQGELILAYQGSIQPGSRQLSAWDYEGNPVEIPLKSDLNASENADRYFTKAKKAKARAQELVTQSERLQSDREQLLLMLDALDSADSLAAIEDLRATADRNKWLQKTGHAAPKEERPFEGHSVRELLSPGGWRVLYGENATSNDYLTSRVAKPSDLWFHVRGAPSAHVVLCTNNQAQRVQKPDLEYAARVAVRHSPSKHSGYVSVDYTQKRYVRKPKGSPPGLAVYTHEKTLHVTEG